MRLGRVSAPDIFDTEFDKYTEDAVALFAATGVTTVFVNLEGFPEDWKTNVPAFMKFVREHQCPSFLEYGEYPYVTAEEIKKALKLKAAFSALGGYRGLVDKPYIYLQR